MAVSGTPWYRMDNASVMYSAIQREEYSAIYRFSAWLREEVRPDALQRACLQITKATLRKWSSV